MFKKVLQRKLRVGRFGMPLWILGLTGGLMAAAAGQAVGPVLAGSVTGTVGATVEQTVLVSLAAVTTNNGADGVAVVNDEQTSFTAAIETQVGEKQTLTLTLVNGSGADANAMLELSVPAGLDVEVEATGSSKEAQLSANKWLVFVDKTTPGTLTVDIEPKDDLKPGFYTITGRIVQIAG